MITLSLLFWVLYIIGAFFFILRNRNADRDYIIYGVVTWILIGILGYTSFNGFIK